MDGPNDGPTDGQTDARTDRQTGLYTWMEPLGLKKHENSKKQSMTLRQ